MEEENMAFNNMWLHLYNVKHRKMAKPVKGFNYRFNFAQSEIF